ncbi:Pre-rRNA-processing protein TSR1-like protein, partial [Cucurbita argyrosperma subsp. argyrosperma]
MGSKVPWEGVELKSINPINHASHPRQRDNNTKPLLKLLVSNLSFGPSDRNKVTKNNVAKGARAARLQRNKMIREQKRAAVLQDKRASSGSKNPPRVIVLFGLSASVDLNPLAEDLLSLLAPGSSSSTVASSEYKLRATVLKAPYGDLQSCMEMAKVADLIAFVTSASYYIEGSTSLYIDSFGSECLSLLRSLGLPSTAVFIRDLPTDIKKRNDYKKMCISSITSEFPEDCKFYPADTKDELHKSELLNIAVLTVGVNSSTAIIDIIDRHEDRISAQEQERDLHLSPMTELTSFWQRIQLERIKDLPHALTDASAYSPKSSLTTNTINDGENLTNEQKLDEIQKIKNAHADDEEFPDEVDTPMDIPARKRFAKYRGLKSFRTSSWDPQESLPQDYARIFEFSNISRTQKHVLAKALELEQGNRDDCVASSSYLRLHVKEVPIGAASKLCELAKSMPITACGLLQHESKMSVLHFSIKMHDVSEEISDNVGTTQNSKKHDKKSHPLKGKEKLVFHVGFRQFVTRPIFSSDNFNSDKHKMERFLHAGRFSIASIYAPISFAPLPLIVLRNVEGISSFAASGSLKCIDPRRIILKKIILSGYPQRVSKLKATVRYMFHNPDDVRWFKQHDTVCMSLYKRVYPKWPEHLFPLLDV